MSSTHVLVIDDDEAMGRMLEARLVALGMQVTATTRALDALEVARTKNVDVVVTDVNMPGLGGLDLCRRLLEIRPNLPVILMTGFGTMETAIEAIRAGAYDFLPKPFATDQLVLTIERAVEVSRLKNEVVRLRAVVAASQSFDQLIGASAKMVELYALLDKLANSDAAVLISGESGTGKELVARALHAKGARARGPFVAVNCAAMPEALLESELFGHVKGAFTDAKNAKPGLFVSANDGTVFLDEIGELPLGLQPKLLRALQERKVRPVGGTAEIPFNARVVSATNRDLETMVEERTFREDLFFRINVIEVPLPPLRARGDDILILAQYFLERVANRVNKKVLGLSPEAAQKLVSYSWPGNVRELENCMERAVAIASFDHIAVDDLPQKIRQYKPAAEVATSDGETEWATLEEAEHRYVLRVLTSLGGNKSAAARVLNVERKTLQRMMKRWGLESE